tara:strand:- start:1 stop:909 length:909 start_codon:yes stop_codon:yes gene_type:complete
MATLGRFLPYVGILAAIGAAVAASFAPDATTRQTWSLSLLAVSMISLWVVAIRVAAEISSFAKSRNAERASSEEMLVSLLRNEPKISDRLLRQGFFGGSPVDDQFWLIYCQMLRSRYFEHSDSSLAREIVWSLTHQKIRVKASEGYIAIKQFAEALFAKSMRFYAVATQDDLEVMSGSLDGNPHATFLLDFPIRHPEDIQRIFVVANRSHLKSLSDEVRQKLCAQIRAGADLRVAPAGLVSGENIGIYGDVAVGEYDEENQEEIINFNRDYYTSTKSRYAVILESSEPLTFADFGIDEMEDA